MRLSILSLVGLMVGWLWLAGGSVAQNEPPLYNLPDARGRLTNSSSIAFASNAQLLIAVNPLNNTVSIVNPFQPRLLAEVPVGRDPRTVAVTPDSTRAVIVNRGDGTLSLLDIAGQAITATIPVGTLPYGVVTLDDQRAIVALQGTDEVVIVDLVAQAVVQRIATMPDPAGLALWGDLVYVTHLWGGGLTLIHLPQARTVDYIPLGRDLVVSQSVTIDPQRGVAYLPQTRLNTANPAPTYDTLAFPIVNVVDLRNMRFQRPARIALDVADRPVNLPFASAVDVQRRWLYVANAGSNDISVIDLTSNLAVANIPVDANPRGVLLTRDNGTLYVHNAIEGTINVIDTRRLAVSDVIPISNLTIPADLFFGAQLFHSAADPRLTTDRWLSCATCHFEGQSGGVVWEGYPGGRRAVPLLYGLGETAPYNALGDWDELADVELKIRGLQAGSGLIEGAVNPPNGEPHSGLSLDLDTLSVYLASLEHPPAPRTAPAEQIARGEAVFAALNCAACHAGEAYADGQRYDVGTGGLFVTPGLRGLWQSAPYLHDGSAPTLFDLFIMPGAHQLIRDHSREDIEALIAYLNSLP